MNARESMLAKGESCLESGTHCAYNQTKGCFLSLNVIAGEFSGSSTAEWLRKLTPESGLGLWMVPFKGIPDTDEGFAIDLIYIDEECRAIDVVKSFPVSRVNPARPPAVSVLALPKNAIASTETQPGDELMVCASEEMTWFLEQHSSGSFEGPRGFQGPIFSREEIPGSADFGQWQVENPAAVQYSGPDNAQEFIEPEAESIKPHRNWLERWLFPDPPDGDQDQRGLERECVPGLAAHFWTGGAPQVHSIRDISANGLYMVTDERWYLGTRVRITLTKTDEKNERAPRSITVEAEVVRWGNDGVGLSFILQDSRNIRRGELLPLDSADKDKLKKFLKLLNRKD
jgi:hypothetical protein